jgi:hypothetical protein
VVIVGVRNGLVELCVSITPNQLQTVCEMYPEHQIMEQTGDENIGWTYDRVTFTPPQG